MKTFWAICLTILFSAPLRAQSLLSERIREITGDKKSVFLQGGVFHGGKIGIRAILNSMRQSFTASNAQERLVFDISGDTLPKVYGHLNSAEKKLYIDFFNTDLPAGFAPLANGKYIKAVDFFKITQDALTIEVNFDRTVGIDVFYLTAPLRLVIDIKN